MIDMTAQVGKTESRSSRPNLVQRPLGRPDPIQVPFPQNKDPDFLSNEKLESALSDTQEAGGRYARDELRAYYTDMNRLKILSQEEEMALARRIFEENDLQARNELVVRNLRLVRWVASRKFSWSTVPFADLLQEGNIGLITAAERFDYRLGFRFTSYAMHWIQQAIHRAIHNTGSTVRVPVYVLELKERVWYISKEIEAETGCRAQPKEIAERLGVTVKAVQVALMTQTELVSLDQEVYGTDTDRFNKEVNVSEFLIDDTSISADVYIEACEERELAYNRLAHILQQITHEIQISQRDLEIFNKFYGLDESGERKTLVATSQLFGLTHERIRQIIAHIWKKVVKHGGEMNHCRFLQELARIEELDKLVLAGNK